MSNGLLPRTMKYCLFCNCSDVKWTAAENILNTIRMEILKCSDVKRTAADNILKTVSMKILKMP